MMFRNVLATAVLVWVSTVGNWAVGQSQPDLQAPDLESMSAAEKQEFLTKKKRFDALPEAQKEQLRQLHATLQNDTDYDQLQQILDRYTTWLRSLSPTERAAIASLPPDQRIARIKELTKEQEQKRSATMFGSELKTQDLKVLNQWLDDFVRRHEQPIMDRIPPHRRPWRDQPYEAEKHRKYLMFSLLFGGAFPGGSSEGRRPPDPEMPKPTPQDYAALRDQLSPEARSFLEQKPTAEEQQNQLTWWVRGIIYAKMRPTFEELMKFAEEKLDEETRQQLAGLPKDKLESELLRLHWEARRRPGSEELKRFAEEKLDAATRQRIMALPQEERERELLREYYESRKRRGDGGGRGGRGGDKRHNEHDRDCSS